MDYVCDAAPGAVSRPATGADALTHFNDDGTVTIPTDVQVFELDGSFWLRTHRLRGWACIHGSSPVMVDPVRALHVVLREEMARQGRRILRWPQSDLDDAKYAEISYWSVADAAADVRLECPHVPTATSVSPSTVG